MTEKTLDEIMSGRGEAVSDEPQTHETQGGGQERDESGRFAGKAEEKPEPQTETQPEQPDPEPKGDGKVPHQALHASRERERQARDEAQALRDQVQRLEGMMQAMAARGTEPQKPTEQPKPVDFWEDPQAFIQSALTPFQQQIAAQQEAVSRTSAVAEHGAETVDKAFAAMRDAMASEPRAQADYQRIMQSPHPYGELVAWDRNRRALTEIGDPAAYRERMRQELMAELQASQTQTQPAAQPRLPGNFTQARNDGPRSGQTYTGPRPLSDITKGSSA